MQVLHHTKKTVGIFCDDQQLRPQAQAISQETGLDIQSTAANVDYLLTLEIYESTPGYLCTLHKTAKGSPGPIVVDCTKGRAAHRRQYGGGRHQTLARAIGLKPGYNPPVIDVTAGMGKDAFVLASLGCQVSLLERVPAIYILLRNGLQRAQADPECSTIISRMQLHFTTAQAYLQAPDTVIEQSVIYLDPMYPQRAKSARVKKEMQYFHELAGADDDAADLLHQSLSLPCKRIVVKRPKTAEPLGAIAANAVVSSKNTRYDIYLR